MILAWPALVLAVARVLFLALPRWKARRGRVVPLEEVDRDGTIRTEVERLATKSRLRPSPRVVVDPSAASTGAVVFGGTDRPTVCLHGGLLVRRATDPEGFRAVLLHELAHIRNGDISITYATVAIWRVFLVLVLLPFLTWYVIQFARGLQSPFWPSYAPTVTRNLVLTVFLIVLVYLARSDVLRSREIYADLAAVRSGAHPEGWAVPTPDQPRGAARRALAGFVELWRTHPQWDLRRESLNDPAALFSVRAVPMFLTGAAIIMITTEVTDYLKQYNLGPIGTSGSWVEQGIQLFAGPALVTAVVGVALWRAVAYAVLTSSDRVPSGVRSGLWLGAGMAAAELVGGQATINQWWPARIEALGLVVLAGAAFAWWIAQCAQLWIRTWRGRTINPAMHVTLAAATLALASWFLWWQYQGQLLLAGLNLIPDQIRRVWLQEYPVLAADQPVMTWAVNAALSILSTTTHWPLFLVTIAALWIVPLLAWVLRPSPGEPLPPLRRVLLPGLLGGILCWALTAGVQKYLHGWPADQRNGLYLQIYLIWLLVAMVVSAAAAALAASVLADHGCFKII